MAQEHRGAALSYSRAIMIDRKTYGSEIIDLSVLAVEMWVWWDVFNASM